MKTYAITWESGELNAQTDNSNHVIFCDWTDPIDANTDSWAAAEAVLAGTGCKILSVDHDNNTIFAHCE